MITALEFLVMVGIHKHQDKEHFPTMLSHTFSGTPTVADRTNFTQYTSCLPAWYNTGRYFEVEVQTSNTANLDFHCWDANTTSAVNYDGRIQCINGDGATLVVITLTDMQNYAAPLTDALFTNRSRVNVNGI